MDKGYHSNKERWQLVTNFYDQTIRNNKLNPKQLQQWKQWTKAEKDKAINHVARDKNDTYGTPHSLYGRIKAKWWAINHRYISNKNKNRTATKRFIKHASWQDLALLDILIKQRKADLMAKGRATYKANHPSPKKNKK